MCCSYTCSTCLSTKVLHVRGHKTTQRHLDSWAAACDALHSVRSGTRAFLLKRLMLTAYHVYICVCVCAPHLQSACTNYLPQIVKIHHLYHVQRFVLMRPPSLSLVRRPATYEGMSLEQCISCTSNEQYKTHTRAMFIKHDDGENKAILGAAATRPSEVWFWF
jgi:hypothetical protein